MWPQIKSLATQRWFTFTNVSSNQIHAASCHVGWGGQGVGRLCYLYVHNNMAVLLESCSCASKRSAWAGNAGIRLSVSLFTTVLFSASCSGRMNIEAKQPDSGAYCRESTKG